MTKKVKPVYFIPLSVLANGLEKDIAEFKIVREEIDETITVFPQSGLALKNIIKHIERRDHGQ